MRFAEIGFGIDIEAIFVFFINGSFYFFERRTDTSFEFIEECGLESFTKKGVVKVLNDSPESVIGEAALSKKTIDMRIPFERPVEGMQDTDETGDKVSFFVQIKEHPENNAANSTKKALKEGAVIEKERA